MKTLPFLILQKCTKSAGQKGESGIIRKNGVVTATGKWCYCQKDKCNGQVRQESSMMVIVGALLVSVLAKF